MDTTSLVSSGLAFFIVAVAPGPANISNATIAMSHGRRPSFIYGLGLSFGLMFWGLIAATGMGAILQSSLYLLMALKVLGGLYLLWLAFLSGRSAWRLESVNLISSGNQKWFWRGLLLNLSNPKSVLAWLAALSVGLNTNDGVAVIIVSTAVCIALGFAINASYSMLFSVTGMIRGYSRFRRSISTVVAGLFALGGLGMIRSAFSR